MSCCVPACLRNEYSSRLHTAVGKNAVWLEGTYLSRAGQENQKGSTSEEELRHDWFFGVAAAAPPAARRLRGYAVRFMFRYYPSFGVPQNVPAFCGLHSSYLSSMAHRWRLVAVLTMLSALRSGRAFLPLAPGRLSRQLSKSTAVRGVAALDVRPAAAAAAGCLARRSEATTGRYGANGLGSRRGLATSATKLSAVGAVDPVSRTSSTTLEEVR